MTISNLPPPDQLAEVRLKLKELEKMEAELKALILANPDIREGANWLAEVKTVTTQRVDLKELRAMHADLVDEYTFPSEVTRVVLSGITEDGELISARAMRSAEKSGDTQ
jgi:hypothetical protein